jgi:hypothetical protein
MSKSWQNSMKYLSYHAIVHGCVCCPLNTHWKMPLEYNCRENYMQTLWKICYKIHKINTTDSLLTPLQRGRYEWYTDTVCLPQTDSRLSIMFIKHVADWVQHRTGMQNLEWQTQSNIGPQRIKRIKLCILQVLYCMRHQTFVQPFQGHLVTKSLKTVCMFSVHAIVLSLIN